MVANPLSALRLYAIQHPTRVILCDKHSQVIAYLDMTNPTHDDLQALAHDTYPEYPASDFMATWVDERGCYVIEYIPY